MRLEDFAAGQMEGGHMFANILLHYLLLTETCN